MGNRLSHQIATQTEIGYSLPISPPNPNYFNIPNGWNNGIICLYSCNDQFPYLWNGLTFNGPGTQSVTLTNAAGCDSIVTLDLAVNPNNIGTDVQTACSSFTWIDGVTYTSSTNTPQYTSVGGNINGCDSTVNLNLTINQPSSNTINISSCGPYLAGNGQLYAQSTAFTYTIPNAVGCDSNITVNLTVIAVPSAAFSSTPELLEYGLTEIQMIDQSTGQIDTWSWTISSENGNIQSSSLQNPLLYLPNNLSGNITFQLTVSNNQGCTDNATSVLTILEDAAIYIPNSFSPDGNNFNNTFQVAGRNISPTFFELNIFNRWGELIFLSKDLNVGWDGSVNTYGPAPIGVYTYKVSFRFANQDDNQTITGHLNLLR